MIGYINKQALMDYTSNQASKSIIAVTEKGRAIMAEMTPKEALRLLNDMEFSDKYQGKDEYTNMLLVCKNALEKQIPRKPQHIHEEHEKHQWYKDDEGNVDEWRTSFGYCNGPICERCGFNPCVHCFPNYDEDSCIVDDYFCPVCNEELLLSDKDKHCADCGQALDWSDING